MKEHREARKGVWRRKLNYFYSAFLGVLRVLCGELYFYFFVFPFYFSLFTFPFSLFTYQQPHQLLHKYSAVLAPVF
jgi:hypothetical protein